MSMLRNWTYSFFILVCTLTSYTLSAQSNEPCLSLALNEVTAEAGEVICIDLTTTGFTNVLGLQWSVVYDPSLLKFTEVKNFGLPQLDANSFGTPAVGPNNAIRIAWTNPAGQGVDLPDDARIVSFCFEALATSGKAVVEVINTPTPIEFVDGNLTLLPVSGIAGGVRFGDTPASSLTIDDICVLPPTCSALGEALVDVTISGGEAPFTYLWTGPGSFVADVPDFEAMTKGFYTLEVTDANGQVANGMVQVEETSSVNIADATVTKVSCESTSGGAISLTLVDPSEPHEFTWSNGATTQNIDELSAGIYTVTITNTESGCRSVETYTLEQEGLLGSIFAECLGEDEVELSALVFDVSGNTYSYEWSTGETFTGLNEHKIRVSTAMTNVAVTITNNVGCQSVIEVNVPSCGTPPDGGAGNNGACFSMEVENIAAQQGEIACVDVKVKGFDKILGVQNSINWDPTLLAFNEAKNFSLGSVTTSFGQTAAGLAAGKLPFVWTDSETLGKDLDDGDAFYTLCFEVLAESGFATVNITESPTPIEVITSGSEPYELVTLPVGVIQGGIEIGTQGISSLGISDICIEWLGCESTFLADIQVAINGGSPPYAFSWTGPNGYTSNEANIQGPEKGIYTLLVTDQNGDQASALAWLGEHQGLNGVPGQVTPVDCANPNSGAIVLTGLSSGDDYNYTWSNGATTRDISGLSVGPYSVTVSSESTDCVLTRTFDVTLGAIQAGLFYTCIDNPSGSNALVEVTALVFAGGVGPFTFVWSTGEEVVSNSESKIQVNVGDSVSVVITDALGCTYNSQVLSTVCFEGSTGDFAVSYAYDCANDSTTVALTAYVWDGANGPYNFLWSTGEQMSGNTQSTINVPATGTYSVTISDAVGNTQVLGGIKPNCSVLNGTPLELIIGEANATTGESVCLAVRSKGFRNILGIQYAVGWDPAQVELNTVQAFALPNLNAQNFDLASSTFQDGLLRFLWFDPTAMGLSLADDAVLYEMCFTVLGTSGEVPIYFDQSTMQTEAVNEDIASFAPVLDDGLIIINGDDRVWPGDTDNNELANQFDVLNIGLAYDATGPIRQDANLIWQGQWASDWEGETPATAVNFKHIDVNGDGVIDVIDTTGISLNWGRAANFSPNPFEEYRSTPGEAKHIGAPIYIETYTVRPGETADFNIHLGDTENPVEGAYGIAFTIVYDPLAVVYGSAKASFQSSWLGTLGDNMIVVMKDDPSNHRIHVGLTRIDQMEVNGSGRIGVLSLTIEDVIFRSTEYEMEFKVENIRLIRNNEQEIIVNEVETVAMINESPLDTDDLPAAQRLKLYPNPTMDLVSIQYLDIQMDYVQVFNTNGEMIKEYKAMNQISLEGLPATTYLLRFVGPEGVVLKKVIKQ